MNGHLTEALARHQMTERIARAAEPRVTRAPRRHRIARQLRRAADRLEG